MSALSSAVKALRSALLAMADALTISATEDALATIAQPMRGPGAAATEELFECRAGAVLR